MVEVDLGAGVLPVGLTCYTTNILTDYSKTIQKYDCIFTHKEHADHRLLSDGMDGYVLKQTGTAV